MTFSARLLLLVLLALALAILAFAAATVILDWAQATRGPSSWVAR